MTENSLHKEGREIDMQFTVFADERVALRAVINEPGLTTPEAALAYAKTYAMWHSLERDVGGYSVADARGCIVFIQPIEGLEILRARWLPHRGERFNGRAARDVYLLFSALDEAETRVRFEQERAERAERALLALAQTDPALPTTSPLAGCAP
ncbi:MAG: hypothetical protein JWN04_6920 [Myxococcaceae bacterium]|nr:hypothetical protein [Myxococcaceae bacterium]